MSEANEVDGVVMRWSVEPPTIADLNGNSEEYYWMRGGNFNRPVIVRCNNGVTSKMENGVRKYWPEVNFQVFADGWSGHIWRPAMESIDDASPYEYYGPIAKPFA